MATKKEKNKPIWVICNKEDAEEVIDVLAHSSHCARTESFRKLYGSDECPFPEGDMGERCRKCWEARIMCDIIDK